MEKDFVNIFLRIKMIVDDFFKMNWYIFENKLKFYVCGVRGRPRRGASALEWASVGGDFGNPVFWGHEYLLQIC